MYSFFIRKKIKSVIISAIQCLLIFFTLSNAAAQENAEILRHKINIKLVNVPVRKVLSEMEKQTGYTFSYSSDLIKSSDRVSVQYEDELLQDALQQLFDDRLQTVRVSGRQIFLRLLPETGKGIISGKIFTSDGKPAEGVTVQLQGAGIGMVTQSDGSYRLNARNGKYVLAVSFTGLQTQTENITVENDATIEANFTLAESNEQLQDVLVNATKNKFANKSTDDVARMPLANLENPQVYSTVNNNLMKERTITNYAEIFYNVPGVAPPSVMYSNGHEYFLRGFYNGTEFRDGMVYTPGEAEDPVDLERVDILKGPEGTLFGAAFATFGGVINNVSKQPFDHTQGEIDYSAGSWGLSRLTVDYNTPLNTDSSILFRINAARHWENTFQDYGFRHTYDIAPALTYKVNDRLTLNFNAEFYSQNSTMWQWAYFGPDVTIKNIKDLKTPYNRSFAGDQMLQQWSNSRILAQADYKMSNHWHSSTKFLQDYYYRPESYYMNGNEYINDSTMARYIMGAKPQLSSTTEVQQNFTGDFHIGKMRNRLLLGLDVTTQKYTSTFVGAYQDTVVMSNPNSLVNVSKQQIMSQFTMVPGQNHYVSQFYDYSAYASDILNVTDRLLASASLRFDRYDNKNSVNNGIEQTDGYKQNALSPKFGLVYQILKNKVSLFANYMNGFSNNAPQTDGTQIVTYKPSHANQWEGGVKMDVFKDKLSATLSYYNINVNDALRSLPSSQISIQDGTEKSKGFEAQVIANPLNGLNVMAGYGYNDAKYIKASAGLATLSLGAPHNIANFYISYKLMNSSLNGLGIGFGGNYVGQSDYNYPVMIPSYFICNLSLMYDRPKYNFTFKVNNLADEKYWSWNFIQPQPPRNFVASMAIKF